MAVADFRAWRPAARRAGSQRGGSDHLVEGKESFAQEVAAPDELVGGGEAVPLLVTAVAEAAVGGEVASGQGVEDVLGGYAVPVLAERGQLPIILRGCGHFGMIFIPRSYHHTEVDTGRIITTLEEKLIGILARWIYFGKPYLAGCFAGL